MRNKASSTRQRLTLAVASLVLCAIVLLYAAIFIGQKAEPPTISAPPDKLTQGPRPATNTAVTAAASQDGAQALASIDPENEEPVAVPDAPFEEIERAIAQNAKPAAAVIEVDSEMQMGRTYTASLIIQGGDGSGILALDTSTPEPVAQRLDIEIAARAAAYLSSSAFEIEAMSPAVQSIRAQAPTIWRWRLRPTQAGDADLMFVLMQSVLVDGRQHTFPVRQFPQLIRVELTWWLWGKELAESFWGMLMAWLFAGAAIATILQCWREIRKNRAVATASARSRTAGPRPAPVPADAHTSPTSDPVKKIRKEAHRAAGVEQP